MPSLVLDHTLRCTVVRAAKRAPIAAALPVGAAPPISTEAEKIVECTPKPTVLPRHIRKCSRTTGGALWRLVWERTGNGE